MQSISLRACTIIALVAAALGAGVRAATVPIGLSIEAEDTDSFVSVDPTLGNNQLLYHCYKGNWAMYRDVDFR